MNIYLIRHAKAEPASYPKKDRDRELTKDGIEILQKSVLLWKNQISKFDYIFSSPFLRAVQTAEIISKSFNCSNEIIAENLLSPGSTTNSIIHLSASFNEEDIAFIGHQPDISNHIFKFVSNSVINLKFSPASVAKISFNSKPIEGKGRLELLLPPQIT
jgi:phosphohistidine phosphatase